jgi:hypothetical protein
VQHSAATAQGGLQPHPPPCLSPPPPRLAQEGGEDEGDYDVEALVDEMGAGRAKK